MTTETLTQDVDVQKFDAVLCRTNAGCISAALEFGQSGKTFALLISGGIQSLKSFAFAVRDLKNGQSVDHPELGAFKDWNEVQEYAASDEGADLRPMVKIFDLYGVEAILAICMNSLSEKEAHNADIQIVTIHRSKGLEWDRVLIFPDFPKPKEDGSIPGDDLKLAYVAVTRARLFLDCAALAWMFRCGNS